MDSDGESVTCRYLLIAMPGGTSWYSLLEYKKKNTKWDNVKILLL